VKIKEGNNEKIKSDYILVFIHLIQSLFFSDSAKEVKCEAQFDIDLSQWRTGIYQG
jgi:hypothetical protein